MSLRRQTALQIYSPYTLHWAKQLGSLLPEIQLASSPQEGRAWY